MANTFRIINDDQNQVFYIAKAGLTNTSNERRGNRNNPLPDVAGYLASTGEDSHGLVGTGVYQWGTRFAYGAYGANKQNLLADGYVQLLGDGQTRFAALISSGSTFTNLHFEQFAGFNFRSYSKPRMPDAGRPGPAPWPPAVASSGTLPCRRASPRWARVSLDCG